MATPSRGKSVYAVAHRPQSSKLLQRQRPDLLSCCSLPSASYGYCHDWLVVHVQIIKGDERLAIRTSLSCNMTFKPDFARASKNLQVLQLSARVSSKLLRTLQELQVSSNRQNKGFKAASESLKVSAQPSCVRVLPHSQT